MLVNVLVYLKIMSSFYHCQVLEFNYAWKQIKQTLVLHGMTLIKLKLNIKEE